MLGMDGVGMNPTVTAQVEDPSATGKRRFVWTADLHARFEAAVNALGLDHAKPKTILKLMNVDDLTKANIKSHLQKYRCSMMKKASSSPSKPGCSAIVSGAADDDEFGPASGVSAATGAGGYDGRSAPLDGDSPLLGNMELPDPDKLMIEGETSLQRNLEVQEMTLKLQKDLQEKLSTQLELQKNLQSEMETLMTAAQAGSSTAISSSTNSKMTTILALKRKLQHELQAQLRMQHQLLSQLNQVVLPAVERLHTDENGSAPETIASEVGTADSAAELDSIITAQVRPAQCELGQEQGGSTQGPNLQLSAPQLSAELSSDSADGGEEDEGEAEEGEAEKYDGTGAVAEGGEEGGQPKRQKTE